MAFTASMNSLTYDSGGFAVYAAGTVGQTVNSITSYGFLGDLNWQAGTTKPIGNTSFNHWFNLSPSNRGQTLGVAAYSIHGIYTVSSYSYITIPEILPTVTTTAISNVGLTTATGGGNVTDAGGISSSARGVCWNTSTNPTIANSHTHNGTGTGAFTSTISGLTINTLYYVRAYATNSVGTSYGAVQTFTTTYVSPTSTILTGATDTTVFAQSHIDYSGITTVTGRGVCWGSTNTPTIAGSHTHDGNGNGTYNSTITGLTRNLLYYSRAYVTTAQGTFYSLPQAFMPPIGRVVMSGFTSNGNFVVPAGFNYANYLIVAGGGGAGDAKMGGVFASAKSGGGGAGGLLHGTISIPVTGHTYAVVVGAAGVRNQGSAAGSTGGNSSLFGLTAYGGGYGAVAGDITGYPWQAGGNGGNGGGGGSYYTLGGTLGGTGIIGQGNNGGNASQAYPYDSAGAGGSYGISNTGLTSNISGIVKVYAVGGLGGYTGGTVTTNSGNGGKGNYSFVNGQLKAGGDGAAGVVYVMYGIMPDPYPYKPTGETSGSITCTGATLTWVNNNVSGVIGNYIKKWNGSSYDIITTLASGATSYVLTGLTALTPYIYAVAAFNPTYTVRSNDIYFTTQNPAPYNLASSVSVTSATVTWDINDAPYGTSIRYQHKVSGSTNWITGSTTHDATGHTFTGLSFNTSYQAQIVRIGSEYPSPIITFTTGTFLAPSGLTYTGITYNSIDLVWTVNSVNDNQEVWYRGDYFGSWVKYADVSNTTNTIVVTGLTMTVEYEFLIKNIYGIYELESNRLFATPPFKYLIPWCEATPYNVYNTVCGSNSAVISFNTEYLIIYTVQLFDSFGNEYNYNTYTPTLSAFVGLGADWYRFVVTPKPLFWVYYGKDPCIINWIPIEDMDTTLLLNDMKIKPAVCGGWGQQLGRLVYQITDSSAQPDVFSFRLYRASDGYLVNSQTITGTTGVTNIVIEVKPNSYYGYIENEDGCTLLLDIQIVPSETLYTVPEIGKIYITPWASTVEYNYWSSADDDFFVQGLDTTFFTSTKIKEYLNLPDPYWYQITLDTATVSYGQVLNKNQNGLTYEEKVSISIPSADVSKWNELTTLLDQRYIVVFQDNNDQWWTCFYRTGAEIKSYQLSENQYVIQFIAPVTTKMLTSIDEAYIKNNIL